MDYLPYLLALAIGVIAGLRAHDRAGGGRLGGLAPVRRIHARRRRRSPSWARSGRRASSRCSRSVELVTDQLPSTPSRKVPMQFGARLVIGALPARRSARRAGMLVGGLVAGIVGAVIGTLGGAAVRARAGRGVRQRPAGRAHRGRGRDRRRAADRRGSRCERERFDAIIIGAGQAGPPLAGRLTAAGMKVALIERKLFGGTCVNTGCMPTKTLVASAYAAHLARRGGRLRRRDRRRRSASTCSA